MTTRAGGANWSGGCWIAAESARATGSSGVFRGTVSRVHAARGLGDSFPKCARSWRRCARDSSLGVISNFDGRLACRSSAISDLARFFDPVVISSEVGADKPDRVDFPARARRGRRECRRGAPRRRRSRARLAGRGERGSARLPPGASRQLPARRSPARLTSPSVS